MLPLAWFMPVIFTSFIGCFAIVHWMHKYQYIHERLCDDFVILILITVTSVGFSEVIHLGVIGLVSLWEMLLLWIFSYLAFYALFFMIWVLWRLGYFSRVPK